MKIKTKKVNVHDIVEQYQPSSSLAHQPFTRNIQVYTLYRVIYKWESQSLNDMHIRQSDVPVSKFIKKKLCQNYTKIHIYTIFF